MTPLRRSGFAMVTAIMLLSLCGMAMTVLSVTVYEQAKRAQMQADDAQLRALLNAGAAFAAKMPSSSQGRIVVPLPDSLGRNSTHLTVDFQSDSTADERIAEISASLPHRQMSQRLILSLQDGVWRTTQADLRN